MAVAILASLSWLCGWIYTLAWSLSFYPQPLLNWQRRSTSGTTIDYPFINTLGFVALSAYNGAFLWSDTIRRQYAARHHGLAPTVQLNDFAFAAHAAVLSVITLSQFAPTLWSFDTTAARCRGARVSRPILGTCVGSVVGVACVVGWVAQSEDENAATAWAWIDVVYALSYVKLVVTLVKYMPQVITNYHNRSTQGWSIGQILLDAVGGVLSILQLCIDSYLQQDWAGIAGNPIKLALGNISMAFDVVFMVQHYVLYHPKLRDDVEQPLLADAVGD